MKRLIVLIVFCTGLIACKTAPPVSTVKPDTDKQKIGSVIVTDPNGDLRLSREQFEAIYRAAMKWFNLRDEISSATVKKNIIIERKSEDEYHVTLVLDEGRIKLTAIVDVDNTELKELRKRMKLLTTQKPNVQIERISRAQFRVTMTLDSIKWSADLNADVQERFHWPSYVYGFASAVLVAIGGVLGKAAVFLPLL